MSGEPFRLEPAEMKTSAGHELAEPFKRRMDKAQSQIARLIQVLNEFSVYSREVQADLTDTAICWAVSSLAQHDRREECKSNFYAIVDMMYSSTYDAEKNLSESERQQLRVSAIAVNQHLVPAVNQIIKESAEKLSVLPKNAPRRIGAELMGNVRAKFLDHASPTDLRDYVRQCTLVCTTANSVCKGIGNPDRLSQALTGLIDSTKTLTDTVLEAIEGGSFVLRMAELLTLLSANSDCRLQIAESSDSSIA
jgi:hypothetical protein